MRNSPPLAVVAGEWIGPGLTLPTVLQFTPPAAPASRTLPFAP